MSVLDNFFAASSIRLNGDQVGLDVVEPPRFAGIPVITSGPRREHVYCITKRRGSLDATLSLMSLRITIPFTDTFLGVDSQDRWVVRWAVDDRSPRPFGISHVQGQVTTVITTLEPFRTDLTDCSGSAGEFDVGISLLAPSDTDPHFPALPNEIRVEAAGVTPVRALITDLSGSAGSPPTPWSSCTPMIALGSYVPTSSTGSWRQISQVEGVRRGGKTNAAQRSARRSRGFGS